MLFFFFQAEDGIRNLTVTGVQTCALPISLAAARECDRAGKAGVLKGVPFGVKDIFDTADMPSGYGSPIYTGCQIGRASGRGKVEILGGAGLLKKKKNGIVTDFATHRYARY